VDLIGTKTLVKNMIDETQTLELFGYHVSELTPRANKQIIVICEKCGKQRVIWKFDHHKLKEGDLCRSCSAIGITRSEETRKKMSIARMGILYSEETLERMSIAASNRSKEHLKRLSDAQTGKSLSKETRKKIGDSERGANNSSWKGGITSIMQRFYHSVEYAQWRTAVFQRDNFTCQKCGNHTSGNLNAHHILPVRDWRDPQYSLNLMNGITLCKDCHRETFNGHEYEFFSEFFDIANGITQPTN